MNCTMIASQAYQPLLAPTGQRNRKAARCADCKIALPAGEARQWDFTRGAAAFLANAHSIYLCRGCHEHRLALLEIEPALRQALADIEVWCKDSVPLSMGWHASRHIVRIARSCDLAAADVARQVCDELYALEYVEYSAVIAIARRVAGSVDAEWVL